jgi:integrase
MPSVTIEPKKTKSGTRYLVRYRLGGRAAPKKSIGTFRLERDAKARQRWAYGEIAANRVPVPDFGIEAATLDGPLLRPTTEAWIKHRIDADEQTKTTWHVNMNRVTKVLGDPPVTSISYEDVNRVISDLWQDGEGLAYESIRKTRSTLSQVLDFADIDPNPCRHKHVLLPPKNAKEIIPAPASDIEKVFYTMAEKHPHFQLPLLVLDASGQRITELELMQVGDLDDTDVRFRLRKEATKNKKARFVPMNPVVFGEIIRLNPVKGRLLKRQLFEDFEGDTFRTALTRACVTAGVPHIWPHLLRHRRATLLHLGGMPTADAALILGHSQKQQETYIHAMLQDRSEIDYAKLISALQ